MNASYQEQHINTLGSGITQKPTKLKGTVRSLKKATTLVKVKQPVIQQGTERVFCGSPEQRNWKNSNATNIAIGRKLAAQRGWTGSQFNALKELWSCESSWNHLIGNTAGSGAYGIPQSLPASKMASHGEDYLSNPVTQIKWGLDYIANRYSNPQAALTWHYTHNWY